MEEVIALMNKCSGAIVLGYPQVCIQEGLVKDKRIAAPLWLSTEWNHIEAALACAQRLPLLMIHHHGVGRGVFDRGAISSFVYEIDLASKGWPLERDISNALKHWKEKVLVSVGVPAILSDDALQQLSGLYIKDKKSSASVSMLDAMGELQGIFAKGINSDVLAHYLSGKIAADVPVAVAEGFLGNMMAFGILELHRRPELPPSLRESYAVTKPLGLEVLQRVMREKGDVKAKLFLRAR